MLGGKRECRSVYLQYMSVHYINYVLKTEEKGILQRAWNYFNSIPDKKTTDRKVESYQSLPSSLTDGFSSIHQDDRVFFTGHQPYKKDDIQFVLPLLFSNEESNVIPQQEIFFYSMNGIDGASLTGSTLAFQLEDGTIKTVYCSSNCLIFHSTQDKMRVVMALKGDRSDWKHIELFPYRSVAPLSEKRPFVQPTKQTKLRDQIVEDALLYNIPTLIEGVTSSGKTFTVEQYCMRALLPLVRYNFSPSSTIEELLGDIVITKESDIKYMNGPFTDAFVFGKILLLDEMSLAQSTVVQSILSFLFSKLLLYEGSGRNEEKKMHAHFRVIATQNPAGSSYKRSTMSDSIRDCFRVITHDARNVRYFPMIEPKERCEIITGMFHGDAKMGNAVSAYHEKAENRKKTTTIDYYKGRDYTLRDCSRVQSLMKCFRELHSARDQDALQRAAQLAYNLNEMNTKPLIAAPPITFTHDRLDTERWKDVYDRVTAGIESGCHILLVGKTEYDARKYCHAILGDKLTGIIHCSSSSSTENIIGGYTLKEQDGRMLPTFDPSPLLVAIKSGGACVLQSMETMKSNVIERLNSILELCPSDGRRHVVRFDENREEPDYVMDPTFRVVATTSEKGLLAFSPALRNRFLEVFIGEENRRNMTYSMKAESVEVRSPEEEAVAQLVEKNRNDVFEYHRMCDMLLFFKHSTSLALDGNLLEVVRKNQPLSKVAGLAGSSEKECELLKSISLGRASVLYGPKGCGKTTLVNELLKRIHSENHHILHVSAETDYGTLMGSIDTRGDFKEGVLYRSVVNGDLVVFDNAENMTMELLEMLDILLDPFATEFSYPVRGSIHPAFRCLFVFTSRREKLTVALPAFFRTVSLGPLTAKRVEELVRTEVCKHFSHHIEKGEITMNEVFVLDSVLASCEKPVLVAAALLADREDKKTMMLDVLDEMKVDEGTAQSAKLIMDAKAVTIEPRGTGRKYCFITRGDYQISAPVLCDEIMKVDSSIQLAVFTACLTSFKTNHLPLLLVGDPDITSEVNRLLAPSSVTIELSQSIEMSHLFGEVSLCHMSDVLSIIRSLPMPKDNQEVLLGYRQYLERKQEELTLPPNEVEDSVDPSSLVYRPGPLLRSVICGIPLYLSNINLLNERLLCRLYGLLFNLSNNEFVLFEDNTKPQDNIVDESSIVMLACDSPDYARVEKKDCFLQVFCRPFSPTEVSKYQFKNKETYPLSILRKSETVRECFVDPSATTPDYLTYLQSETSARQDLIERMSREPETEPMTHFLFTARDAKVSEVMLKDSSSLSGLFTKEVLDSVWSSLVQKNELLPTKTTIQLLLSVALADRGDIPVILEGDPGVGKTAATENYLLRHAFTYKRINFSNSTTADTLFGCYTIVNGNPTFKDGSITELLVREPLDCKKALLFDEVNLAPSDVLELLLTLIRCYSSHSRFQIPGSREIELPSKLLIVCCMNPASMSANRSVLPRRFYSHCLYHRGLSYSLSELFCTAKSILNTVSDKSMEEKVMNLFTYSFKSEQKTSIPFSLRDVLKVEQICMDKSSNLSLEAALWLVFACRYEESDRREVERILGKQENVEFNVIKNEDTCTVTGFWDLEVPTPYNPSFKEWALSTSECLTVYKLSMALRSKRAILVYGSSPSGKSYSILNVAQMHAMRCQTVYLNHDSTPDSFIGRNTISRNEDGKENLLFRPGPLVEAMQNGSWVVIEDIHLANNDVMECLNSLCEENPSLKVTQGEKEVTYVGKKTGNEAENQVQIRDGFRMFFTISENTLKHFTGPFLSRCVIVFCDSIANSLSVQEICQSVESECNAAWFGEKESARFRRCMRVINSREKDAFRIEFGEAPTAHPLLAKRAIPHTIEFQLRELNDKITALSDEEKVKEVSAVLMRLVNSTPRSFDRQEVVPALQGLELSIVNHFILFVLRKMVALLSSGDLENTILKRQPNENAVVLRKWSCACLIDTPFRKGCSVDDIELKTGTELKDLFSVDYTREHELLLLNYICERSAQYTQSLEYPELQYLMESFFSYLDSSESNEKAAEEAKRVLEIRREYKELHTLCENNKRLRRTEMALIVGFTDKIEDAFNALPSSLKSSRGAKTVLEYCKTKREAADDYLINPDDDDEDETTMQCAYDNAMRQCNNNQNLMSAIREAFDGKMDKRTYSALQLNRIDMDYKPYDYSSATSRLIAMISHCLYKLKHFSCPVFIINEYCEVFNKLHLTLPCIITYFSEYETVKESLFVLLNALLVKEMEASVDWWEGILDCYNKYPFYTPVLYSNEQIDGAIDVLMDNSWYDSCLEGVKRKDIEKKLKELQSLLTKELHRDEEGDIRSISLLLPVIIKDIDSGNCEQYTVDQLNAVESNWICELDPSVKRGSVVPSIVLQRECVLHRRLRELRTELECVWKSNLSLTERLMIVCPRKRSALGSVVLDILKSKSLHDTALDVLPHVSTVDELVSGIQERMKHNTEEKLTELKNEVAGMEEMMKQKEEERDGLRSTLMEKKKEMVEKYTRVADEENKRMNVNNNAALNKRSLHFHAYLAAVNAMQDGDVDYYFKTVSRYPVDKWRKNLKDKYTPFSFQVVTIDREWWNNYKDAGDSIEMTILPPNGLPVGLTGNVIRVDKQYFHQPRGKDDFVYLTLPLAPFKWNIAFNEKGEKYCRMKYYCRELYMAMDLDRAPKPSFIQLKLLHSMVKCRRSFSLYYSLSGTLNQSLLYNYCKVNGDKKLNPSAVFILHFKCALFSADQYYLCGEEATSETPILPVSEVSFEKKKTWTCQDYIFVYNETISSKNDLCKEDVADYDACYKEYQKVAESLRQDKTQVDKKKTELGVMESELGKITGFFFPSATFRSSRIDCSSSLNDAVVLMKENENYLICLPKKKEYRLPENYVGLDGSSIVLPVISMCSDVLWSVESEDCDVTKTENGIVVIADDAREGENRVMLKITLLSLSHEKVAEDEFSLVFRRTVVSNLIRTSCECSFRSDSWSRENKLYPSSFPVTVWIDGREKTIHQKKDRYYHNGRWYYDTSPSFEVISSNPYITVDRATGTYWNKGTLFTYNDSGTLGVFTKTYTSPNTITLNSSISVNTKTTLADLQSNDMSRFLSAFSSLSLVLVSCKSSERQTIVSILSNCVSSTLLLPSIKKKAQDVLNLVSKDKVALQWVEDRSIIIARWEHPEDDEMQDQSDGENEADVGKVNVITNNADEKPGEPGGTHYTIVDTNMGDVIDNVIKAVVLDMPEETDGGGGKPVEAPKEEKKKETKKAEDYQGINYREYLKKMEKQPMNAIFENAFKRRGTVHFVNPKLDRLVSVSLPDQSAAVDREYKKCVISTASHIVYSLMERNKDGKIPYAKVNVIIDTNYSHKTGKARLRSLVASTYLTVLRELGVPFDLYVSCGRKKFVQVEELETRSLDDLLCLVSDLEGVVKIPSTPLDLISSFKSEENTIHVIISDGFSEQLMSIESCVNGVFTVFKNQVFLLCVVGSGDEALSGSNQSQLESSLKHNFNDNMMLIKTLGDMVTKSSTIASFVLSSEVGAKPLKSDPVDAQSGSLMVPSELNTAFESTQSVVMVSTITAIKKASFVDIRDADLNYMPVVKGGENFIRGMNSHVKPDNYFDSLNLSFFVPNKASSFVAATSGTSIIIAKYIKYLVTKSGDGKFFKKLGSAKTRYYNCGFVIDCSSLAFSETNRPHSLVTIFTLLRNLSNLQLPCVDIWVATNVVTRVATGVASVDLWETPVIAAVLEAIQHPVSNTALHECLRYACCTCNSRSFSSVMMVCTNGVLCKETREEIQSVVSTFEMNYVGIGIGSYLCGFYDLFPSMIWHSNPLRLSDVIASKDDASKTRDMYGVVEKKADASILSKKGNLHYNEVVEKITNVPSEYELQMKDVRVDDATENGVRIGDIDSNNKYDLGADGGFSEYTVLFVILYLCRNERDGDGKIIDESITEEVLVNGKEVKGERFSPVLKLGPTMRNGKYIGKAFNIQYAFDYKTAIDQLMSGKIRVAFITCSPGDGVFPKNGDRNKDYCNAFLETVNHFYHRGGGVFWFLENYPYTYEADLYFKKFYNYDIVKDKEKNVAGGNFMKRVKKEKPGKGQFVTYGGDVFDISRIAKLDFGLTSIYEGQTLCEMDEARLVKDHFCVFARESSGCASIVFKEDGIDSEGRMIIDTAASKLFLEFTSKGTARWISNAAVWLCNTGRFNLERDNNAEAKTGIDMRGLGVEKQKLVPFVPREQPKRAIDFCLSVVFDTTGSMGSAICSVKETISSLLRKLEAIKKQHGSRGGAIVGQIMEYKDYGDRINNNCSITSDFGELKRRVDGFSACAGSGCGCEDMQYGVKCALSNMTQSAYREYYHMMVIIGDYPNHGDNKSCRCYHYKNEREGGRSYDSVWNDYFNQMRKMDNLQIWFMPINPGEIRMTYNRFKSNLGDKVNITSDTSGDQLKTLFDNTITEVYSNLMGIS